MSKLSGFSLKDSTRVLPVRLEERLRKAIKGGPTKKRSQITPQLYLGGSYRKNTYARFREWGITGIVNMRSQADIKAPAGFEILQLKTRDHHPPSLESLAKGVEFMQRHIKKGGSVYVHCWQGEGRAPTMMAAYLISEGMTADQALNLIQKNRPQARPNKFQYRRLLEWQELRDKHN